MKKILSVLWLGLAASVAHGGVFSTTDPFPFVSDSKGAILPLAFVDFKLLMGEWLAVPAPAGEKLRKQLEEQVANFKKGDVNRLGPEEISTYAAALIRLNKIDEALNVLLNASRNRAQDGFLVQSELAHVHYLRGEYREALEAESTALRDYPPPKKFGSLKPEQWAWILKVEKEFVLPMYRLRRDETKSRAIRVFDAPDELFPYRNPRDKSDVQVINWKSSPDYPAQPIPETDKSKIPADALSALQWMMLNNPTDTRLYWLMGEVFNFRGEHDTAVKIFDESVDAPRNYTSSLLMEHRQALHQSLQAQAEVKKADEEKAANDDRKMLRYISIGIGAIIVVLLILHVRNLIRRMSQ
ncbi:hypothetical protein KIH39_03890 [Telmatocola sphagniphila]|uniref:Tetratricopeptide repeat protein n=1 Tax=Telmatocola sphagniphila TaxID=1123043 RepID=A0A8E6EYV2_9BACT|nr:hypothetical protein [Telmatocola sphagniphila]QVL33068.1 hypothetical protein KIH39_03890 [Telmatocola sphagniphila]